MIFPTRCFCESGAGAESKDLLFARSGRLPALTAGPSTTRPPPATNAGEKPCGRSGRDDTLQLRAFNNQIV